jgi:hypothetical protein
MFEEKGKKALMKNVHDHPVIETGDPHFDVISADIMHRMEKGDPKVLDWNDNIRTLVGLYDQATTGFLKAISFSLTRK